MTAPLDAPRARARATAVRDAHAAIMPAVLVDVGTLANFATA
jgi:hypothetical protein